MPCIRPCFFIKGLIDSGERDQPYQMIPGAHGIVTFERKKGRKEERRKREEIRGK